VVESDRGAQGAGEARAGGVLIGKQGQALAIGVKGGLEKELHPNPVVPFGLCDQVGRKEIFEKMCM